MVQAPLWITYEELGRWGALADRSELTFNAWIRRVANHAADLEEALQRQQEVDDGGEEDDDQGRLR